MKRVFSLLLAVCLCCSFLAVGVSAAESDSYNVLANVTSEEASDNGTTVNGSSKLSFTFNERVTVRNVDIIIQTTGAAITNVRLFYGANDVELNNVVFESLGSGVYRIYRSSNARFRTDRISMEFVNAGTSNTYVTVSQFLVTTPVEQAFPDIGAIGVYRIIGTQEEWSGWKYMADSDSPVTVYWGETDAGNSTAAFPYDLRIAPYHYARYDFMEIVLTVRAISIDSITCVLAGDVIPYEISFMGLDNDGWRPDTDEGGYSNMLDDEITLCITLDLRGVDRTLADFPYITIRGLSAHLSTATWAELITVTGFVDIDGMSQLDRWMMRIEHKFDDLIAVVRGDAPSVDDFQEDVNSQVGELDQAGDVLDSVTKPPVEDVDVSVDVYIDPSGVETVGEILSQFMQNQLIMSMVMISITVALASFIIYGRK